MLEDYGVNTNIFSVTSWNELARDGQEAGLEQLRNPAEERRVPYIEKALEGYSGPFVAVSDYATTLHEQLRRWIPGDFINLGADGFGFSDTREAARRFFNIDAESIVVAVLLSLSREGKIERSVVADAAEKLNVGDPTKA